jgi:hypothetical protein
MFHTTPRCNPKLRQARRRAPTAVILRSSSATPHGVILGRNPQGRPLFFRNPALQLACVARLRRTPCVLYCKKIAAGAGPYETSTGPMVMEKLGIRALRRMPCIDVFASFYFWGKRDPRGFN